MKLQLRRPNVRAPRRRLTSLLAVATLVSGGLVVAANASGAGSYRGDAVMRAADGTRIGMVRFELQHTQTLVRVRFDSAPAGAALDAFHGFHIHANNNPANGDGCLADPAAAASTWFVSADGHWTVPGLTHGNHLGDLPSVLINHDGGTEMRFLTARIDLSQLVGKVVVLHALPDNFANIPLGTASGQYTNVDQASLDRTAATGNAGDRIACGVIERRRG
jgi:superoxide dismutase, Cu-Zn family